MAPAVHTYGGIIAAVRLRQYRRRANGVAKTYRQPTSGHWHIPIGRELRSVALLIGSFANLLEHVHGAGKWMVASGTPASYSHRVCYMHGCPLM